jgi:hypothetical protein
VRLATIERPPPPQYDRHEDPDYRRSELGTSTLANAIAEATQTHALETDDYFWRPSPPYQVKFEPENAVPGC